MSNDQYPHQCPLCERSVPKTSAHHLTPKSRGGKITLNICLDCHGMIHSLFPNKQLDRELDSVDSLKQHPEFAKYLDWIVKRPANRRYKSRRSRKTRNRGRGG